MDHVAKECDQPRNPDTVLCRNCEKLGHFSKDCTEPKDWSKVKCSNCSEMGHTYVVSFNASYPCRVLWANMYSVARLPRLTRAATPLAVVGVQTLAVVPIRLPLVVRRLGAVAVVVAAAGRRLRALPSCQALHTDKSCLHELG